MAFTNPLLPLHFAYLEGSFDVPTEPYTDASGATYIAGAPLTPSGGDLVESTGASPTTNIAGIALQNGSNIVGTHIANSVGNAGVQTPLLMTPAMPGIVFEGSFANAGGDAAPAATDLFVKYGLTKDATTGFWYVDKGKTGAGASVIVVGIKQDSLGVNEGRVFFKILLAETSY